MQQLSYIGAIFIKSLMSIFLLFVSFSMCKIRYFFSAKRSFENLHGIIRRNVFISFILTILFRIEQLTFIVIIKYNKI